MARLYHLPFNTREHHLDDIAKAVNAKAIIIPRSRKSYTYLRYAHVYFESENDLIAAINQDFALNNTLLQ